MKIRNTLILIAYCILVFFISLFGISKIMNKGNTDMTAKMPDATYPILTFKYDNIRINSLYGYADDMDVAYINDNITPLMPGRRIAFAIDTYGTAIDGISFELRNSDGSRLIENSKINNYVKNKDEITGTIELKDLIYSNVEYSLCVKLETASGAIVRYYTRIVDADNYGTKEKLQFAYDFNEATFDRENAGNEIAQYVESDSTGDNTTYNVVDIHSSLSQITWGNLNVKRVTDPVATIKDIDNSIAIISFDYIVRTSASGKQTYYKIHESYRMRQGEERMYLLSYKRDMNQIFDIDNSEIANNKIVLGIANEKVDMVENSDGKIIAFVNDGNLYSYNIADNKLIDVFSFSGDIKDKRYVVKDNDIKICHVDDTGDIIFMVYGHMTEGMHEGMVGIAVYAYDSSHNTVEECTFIPTNKPYDMLARDVKKLSYVSDEENVYLYENEAIYKVNIKKCDSEKIIEGIKYDSLIVSKDNTMAAWAEGGNENDAKSLKWINMCTGEEHTVLADGAGRLKPIAFMGNDLIYGTANYNDIYETASGKVIFPMYKLVIENEEGAILKKYEEPGYYIVDTYNDDMMVSLKRMTRGDNGKVSALASEDQILNNSGEVTTKNKIEVVATDKYEKIVEITLRRDINKDKMQILNPKLVLYEGDRSVSLEKGELSDEYYVYAGGMLFDICSEESKAVSLAYDNGGRVIDKSGREIYKKTSRKAKNQIMAITGNKINDGENVTASLAVCLNTILEFEGISKDTRGMIRNKSAERILSENLKDAEILNLRSCPLDAVLSYVEKDIPVLALLSDGSALLIVGYNEFNIVVMDPLTGTVYKKGMNDSIALFEKNENCFITYMKFED